MPACRKLEWIDSAGVLHTERIGGTSMPQVRMGRQHQHAACGVNTRGGHGACGVNRPCQYAAS